VLVEAAVRADAVAEGDVKVEVADQFEIGDRRFEINEKR
jgi:hypothetical protein